MKRILRILQVDGGDVKGIIVAYLLMVLEKRIGRPIAKFIQVFLGSSTGAVITGCISALIPAETVYKLYTTEVCDEFKNKQKKWYAPWTWGKTIYSRKKFLELLRKYLGDLKFGKVYAKELIITAMGGRKQATHFIKSNDPVDGNYDLVDVISWSALSAVWYFGGIYVPNYIWNAVHPNGTRSAETGEVFQDGGQGVNNCTVMYALTEILAKYEKDYDEIQILSIGTGDYYKVKTAKDVKNDSNIKDVLNFTKQAREEATPLQVGAGMYVAGNNSKYNIVDLT